MPSIATLGPVGSEGFLAAKQFDRDANLHCFNSLIELLSAFEAGNSDFALIPFYNTREGVIKEYFKLLVDLDGYYWIDNIVLPLQLSMGAFSSAAKSIHTIIGRGSVFNQCKDYIKANYPEATLVTVQDIESKILELKDKGGGD